MRSNWTNLHHYNRLVEEKRAMPLSCPDCKKEFTWLIGEDDEPVAWCAWEDSKFYPGSTFWDRVKRTIIESEEE